MTGGHKANQFADPAVKAAFDAMPAHVRKPLLRLRQLILETASRTPGVGELIETLKWGEPAYLPKKPRIGTTVRISSVRDTDDRCAAYFHCQTSLVDTFRELYPDSFEFAGNRAIVMRANDPVPEEVLRDCIAMALTYHLRRRAG